MNTLLKLVLLAASITASFAAQAGGVDRLKQYFKNSSAIRAQFHQSVKDSQGRSLQEVDGTMQLQRPGKFRWDYQKPYVQQIVGDGEKIWLYDPDLNQVTVRNLTKVIGSSPAALLAGNNEMEQNFVLKDIVRKDGLEWVQATPKAQGMEKQNEFDQVFFAFKGDTLQAIELQDSFGNTTNIVFSNVERNPAIPAQSFVFKPPQGADVVGE